MATQHATAHPLEPLAPGELERAAALVRDARRRRALRLDRPPGAGQARVPGLARGRPASRALRARDRGRSRAPRAGARLRRRRRHDRVAACAARRAARRSRPRTTRRPPRPCVPTRAGARPCGGAASTTSRSCRSTCSPRADSASRSSAAGASRARSPTCAPTPGDNGYAHPIESLIAYVDLDECRVLELEELDVKPIPEADGAYAAGTVAARDDLRPIEIAQPEGVSFTVEGNAISWYRWSLRAAIDPQEGLVLHDVRFDGRPVLHRASCAEMIVPYGEPHPMHCLAHLLRRRRVRPRAHARTRSRSAATAWGRSATSTPSSSTASGRPRALANAICLHEEDAGLLWKHSDELAGRVEVRRARRFVAQLDGHGRQLRLRVPLVPAPRRLDRVRGAAARHRLDDGARARRAARGQRDRRPTAWRRRITSTSSASASTSTSTASQNSVREVESESVPAGPGESARQRVPRARHAALRASRRRGATATSARRASGTSSIPARRNGLGGEAGYRLVPLHGVSTMLAQPDARVSRRAGFARHTLWVTPPRGRGAPPVGPLSLRQPETTGLPQWSAGRPPARGDRRRALVHGRHDALRAPRGLADHARGPRRLPARARRLLRPQPVAGRPAAACLPRRESGRLDLAGDCPRSPCRYSCPAARSQR